MLSMGSMITRTRMSPNMLKSCEIDCPADHSQSSASPRANPYLQKTVNQTSVVSAAMPRNETAMPWLEPRGYVKKATRFRHLRTIGRNDTQRPKQTHGPQSPGDRRQQNDPANR